jgi:predicted phosphohydrolase
MKLRLFSDLHNEIRRAMGHENFKIPYMDGDKDTVLILAGDIDTRMRIGNYADSYADQFRAVIYVYGNHDYWGGTIGKEKVPFNDNVHCLANKTIEIDGIQFIGATLWTDFRRECPMSLMNFPQIMVPDSKKIRIAATQPGRYNRRIWAEDLLHEHMFSLSHIKRSLSNFDGKQVVVSHHSPSYRNENPYFVGSNSSDYYHSELDHVVEEADLWMFGHTHHNVDHTLDNGTRMVSNQLGYMGEFSNDFDANMILEV